MSTIKVDTITNGGSTVDFTYNAKVGAGSGALKKEYYEQSTEPTYPCDGALWFNTSDDVFKIYVNNGWYTTAVEQPPSNSFGTRGVFAGGLGSPTNVIDYVTIASPGNATDFGDLTVARGYNSGCSNGTRGITGPGSPSGGGTANNTLDYITIATPGNATDFGDLTESKQGAAGFAGS